MNYFHRSPTATDRIPLGFLRNLHRRDSSSFNCPCVSKFCSFSLVTRGAPQPSEPPLSAAKLQLGRIQEMGRQPAFLAPLRAKSPSWGGGWGPNLGGDDQPESRHAYCSRTMMLRGFPR
jgi:hypothetical protein